MTKVLPFRFSGLIRVRLLTFTEIPSLLACLLLLLLLVLSSSGSLFFFVLASCSRFCHLLC